ncbi:hypothetical protein [Flavobacterium sp.]|uniref:hypothetical protein n=1 Tax=Flavobacterium sp. TaxID=239 RepID=UPI00122B7775|nr:hypothetical protein [Flavobacterium sp.]RZJ71784.1 MAG: hypothetical protein EOO49_08960 [Flavobacterium sp.]
MTEITMWSILTLLVFATFLAMLVLGFKNKNRKVIKVAFLALFCSLSCAIWTIHLNAIKSYSQLSNVFTPRTGDEIYNAMFGQLRFDCVKVLNYQDRVIPMIDSEIKLHFKTCPQEIKKILIPNTFKAKIMVASELAPGDGWFRPETLGESILFFEAKDKKGNTVNIYASRDCTNCFARIF